MKKIKQGNKLKTIWRGTCHRCGSEFEAPYTEIEDKIQFTPYHELRTKSLDDRREISWAEVECPDCRIGFNLYEVRTTRGGGWMS